MSFFNFKTKRGILILEHLKKYTRIIIDIQVAGIKLKEEDILYILLKSLPKSYNSWVESFINRWKIYQVGVCYIQSWSTMNFGFMMKKLKMIRDLMTWPLVEEDKRTRPRIMAEVILTLSLGNTIQS